MSRRRVRSVLSGRSTAAGLALTAAGLALPPAHAASLLTGFDPATPALVLGLWLFKGMCVLNGVILCAMGWSSRASGAGPADVAVADPLPAVGESGSRPGRVAAFEMPGGLPRRYAALLAGVLLVALSLRLIHLSDGLWFDEILTLRNYVSLPLGRIFTTFDSQNQHLLYSIAARLTTFLFGPGAVALRLPAVLFGVGSVWALFWFGTLVASRREALLAAMLMAVSYHHVWFSQDARGYTGLLLWTLLGSGLFLRIMRSGAWTGWKLPAAYGMTMALALYTHITAAAILAAHAAIAVAAALSRRSSLAPAGAGLGLAATFSLQLYAPVLPQMLNTLLTPTMSGVSIEWRNPLWLLRESLTVLGRGVPGGWVSLMVALLVVGVGALSYLRRNWIYAAVMLAPAAILGALVVGLAHNLWPRLFFFSAGFGILILMRGFFVLSTAAAPRRAKGVASAVALAVIVASAITVPRAWGPKQDFESAARFVETARRAADAVVTVDMSILPYEDHLQDGWITVASAEELRSVEDAHDRTWLLYTFPNRLAAVHPGVWSRVQARYRRAAAFDGTVSQGTVVVMVRE